MDKVLRSERLETDPNSGEASKEWLHWKRTFDNFLAVLPQTNLDKLSVLANFVSPSIFQDIEECTQYGAGVGILQALLLKPRNEIFARHILATRCNNLTKRWMNTCLTMFDQARSLELAMRNSESYSSPPLSVNVAVPPAATEDQKQIDLGALAAVGSDTSTCFFCGNSNHPRSRCPARDAVCFKCQKKGHFANVCRGRKISKNKVSAAAWSPTLATVDALNPFQSLWELLLSKDWKSKPSLIVVALKALFIQGWWRKYSSHRSSFIWYSIHGYLSIQDS